MQVDAQKLITHIKDSFLNENRYQMHRTVTEFREGDKFLGDYFQFLIYEPNPKAPIIYSTNSPFDLVTKKAPDRALVFQDGEVLLNIDFSDWVKVRTGAMDAVIMGLCPRPQYSKILYIGAGGTAQWSLKIVKQSFPDIDSVDYHNTAGGNTEFENISKSIGVEASYVDSPDYRLYDYIFIHTNTPKVVLGADVIDRIKPGAVITTYITSTDHGEVADEFYNTEANVILDWDKNLTAAKDLARAVESEYLPKEQIVYLKDLLNGKQLPAKSYTIARFCGTPIQNLAVLKYLLAKAS